MDNVVRISFADSKIPEFKKLPRQDYISFGEDNAYPDYLLYLYNKSAKHNAIINGKVKYIFGGGLTVSEETDQKAIEWAANINSSESLSDITKRTILDIELFGGFYWQVIPKLGGGRQIYHLPFNKCRRSEDGKIIFFKYDWSNRKEDVKEFPAFHSKIEGASVFFFGEYRPDVEPYCLPGYVGSVNYIASDIEVSKHTLTSAQKGWRPTKMVTLPNGEPTEDKKRDLKKLFAAKTEGSEGDTYLLNFINNLDQKPIIEDLGVSELTKENFKNIDELISANIYAGHEITSPILFGIKEAGQLGGTTELRNAYEIFKNTYASNKQIQLEKIINQFAALDGVQSKFKFVHAEPIGFEFTESTILKVAPASWLYERIGIDTNKYKDGPVDGGSPVQPGEMVNDHLKNLTGKQMQQYERILRKYDAGQLTRQRAAVMLKTSLGLSDEVIETLLAEEDKFGKEYSEEEIAEMFSETGVSRDGFEIIETREIDFVSDKDAAEYELRVYQFADEERDKKTTDKIIKNLPKVEIKYSYELSPGVSGPPVIPTTRPFCRKLLQLDRLYSRKEIEMISERVGYSVWDRRGGFWGNKPYCRHKWKSNIVIKK